MARGRRRDYDDDYDRPARRGPSGCLMGLLLGAVGLPLLACGGCLLVVIIGASRDQQPVMATQPGEKGPGAKLGGRLSVEIVKVRLEPFRAATGHDTKMVYVDWQNTGDRPVRAVAAKIRGYDERGNEVEVMPVESYYIYAAAGNDRPGIAPGETYVEPKGEGHVIAPLLSKSVTRVRVEIVKVEEKVHE